MNALKGKVAIVTGASSGIGRAAAKLFAANGADLIIAARRGDRLDQLAEQISEAGGRAFALAGDITDEEHHRDLVEAAVARFGGLDIAFNNAGSTGVAASLPDLATLDWRDTIDTNLTSAYFAAKYQLPALEARGGGSLLFTSSFVGHTVGFPSMAAYAAAKAGIVGLTQVLAAEYGACNIRVNALLPGGTDTPMGRKTASSPELLSFVAGLHALKRMARPEEIAAAALFLVSDSSSFVTGTAMLADGGVSITRT